MKATFTCPMCVSARPDHTPRGAAVQWRPISTPESCVSDELMVLAPGPGLTSSGWYRVGASVRPRRRPAESRSSNRTIAAESGPVASA